MSLTDKLMNAIDSNMKRFQERREKLEGKPAFEDIGLAQSFLSDEEITGIVNVCGDSENLWQKLLARAKPIRSVIEFETSDETGPRKWTVEVTYRASEVKIRTTTEEGGA